MTPHFAARWKKQEELRFCHVLAHIQYVVFWIW